MFQQPSKSQSIPLLQTILLQRQSICSEIPAWLTRQVALVPSLTHICGAVQQVLWLVLAMHQEQTML